MGWAGALVLRKAACGHQGHRLTPQNSLVTQDTRPLRPKLSRERILNDGGFSIEMCTRQAPLKYSRISLWLLGPQGNLP